MPNVAKKLSEEERKARKRESDRRRRARARVQRLQANPNAPIEEAVKKADDVAGTDPSPPPPETPAPATRHKEETPLAQIYQEANDAAVRLAGRFEFNDYKKVGRALCEDLTLAMYRARTNLGSRLTHRRQAKEDFEPILETRPYARLFKKRDGTWDYPGISRMIYMMDNLQSIEEWLDRKDPTERIKLNNPSWIVRTFMKETPDPNKRRKRPAQQSQSQLKREKEIAVARVKEVEEERDDAKDRIKEVEQERDDAKDRTKEVEQDRDTFKDDAEAFRNLQKKRSNEEWAAVIIDMVPEDQVCDAVQIVLRKFNKDGAAKFAEWRNGRNATEFR